MFCFWFLLYTGLRKAYSGIISRGLYVASSLSALTWPCIVLRNLAYVQNVGSRISFVWTLWNTESPRNTLSRLSCNPSLEIKFPHQIHPQKCTIVKPESVRHTKLANTTLSLSLSLSLSLCYKYVEWGVITSNLDLFLTMTTKDSCLWKISGVCFGWEGSVQAEETNTILTSWHWLRRKRFCEYWVDWERYICNLL
jgi:hypothetical protein